MRIHSSVVRPSPSSVGVPSSGGAVSGGAVSGGAVSGGEVPSGGAIVPTASLIWSCVSELHAPSKATRASATAAKNARRRGGLVLDLWLMERSVSVVTSCAFLELVSVEVYSLICLVGLSLQAR